MRLGTDYEINHTNMNISPARVRTYNSLLFASSPAGLSVMSEPIHQVIRVRPSRVNFWIRGGFFGNQDFENTLLGESSIDWVMLFLVNYM